MPRHLSEQDILANTDSYFSRTRAIVEHCGDVHALYAVFMRRPVICAPQLMLDLLERIGQLRKTSFEIDLRFQEGCWVGAGEPMVYIGGSLCHLLELETLILQAIGPPSVAAYNAYSMCTDLPKVGFMAMDARHCTGPEMMAMMAYAASVGSQAAQQRSNAVGFIGSANHATAPHFNQTHALGTMPHALVGYAGSTVKAAQMFHDRFPHEPLTVLIDYYGREISDALEVCQHFKDLAHQGQLSVRMDTLGGRYCEGLDMHTSYATLDRNAPQSIRGYLSEDALRHLVGPGVSAAAIWHLRTSLNAQGFSKVKLVGSSGFGPEKCRTLALANVPLDVIGTGSYLPSLWAETYATADIVAYDHKPQVKKGREFLLRPPL